MRRETCREMVGAAALVTGAAELGVRLLAPHEPAPEVAPVDLGSYFSADELRRGAKFARPQAALGAASGAVQLAVVSLAAARASGRPRRRGRLAAARGRPVRDAAAAATTLVLASQLATLPIAALARRRAVAAGLVTQSWRGWAIDVLKAGSIEGTFAALGGGAVITLMRRYPRGWWALAAGGSVAFGAGVAMLSPVLLDPVFNSFDPLPEGQTRRDVLELAHAAGVSVGEVYSVDASRRTNAANAYVTGLGPTKRVVLFDTLLDRYDRDEIRVVVAHELAHVRGADVKRGIAFAAIVAGPAALATERLRLLLPGQSGTAAVLPSLALAAALVSAPLAPLGARLSRAIERRADAYSLELTGAPEAFISFERRIAVQNLADVDPPRWLQALLASHPAPRERIGAAVAFAATPPARPARRTPAGS